MQSGRDAAFCVRPLYAVCPDSADACSMSNDVPGAIVDKESRFREGLGENVFVRANYRLGRLAQLEPSLAGELGGDCADLGCLDRGLAVEWVRKYIHLFGGNGKRVFTIETSWS